MPVTQFSVIVRKTLLRVIHLTRHHGVLSAVFALAKNYLKLGCAPFFGYFFWQGKKSNIHVLI